MSACKQRAKSIICSSYIVSFTHHNYFYLGKNFWLETTNWFQPSKRQCEINWTSLHEKWEERRSFSEAWHSKQLFHILTAESRILEDIYTKGIKPQQLLRRGPQHLGFFFWQRHTIGFKDLERKYLTFSFFRSMLFKTCERNFF